jgi:hypothetical protein
VQAVPFGDQTPIIGPGNDDRPELHPNHPPIDQIPPMPMAQGGINNPAASDSVIVHDGTANQTWELPIVNGLPTHDQGVGYTPQGFAVPPEMARNFGSMVAASGLTSFPAAGNVRMIMRFVDVNNGNWYYVCSGAMQDAGMVMCAAHCVYFRGAPTDSNGNPIGPPINNWAAEIWVYPGWDGNGGSTPGGQEVIQNWGWTHGTSYLAGADYVNNGNFDRDFGLVECGHYAPERHVGMITGWYGWAYNTDCGQNESKTFYNFSYPAESCSASLHTGRTMYIWSGTWDNCPGNQLQLYTSPGCFTAVWGGMSGSNAYWYDGSNRFAQAVCSTSNRSTRGQYCNMWPQWSTDMNNERTSVRGSGFDLEAFRFRLNGGTTIQATTSAGAGSFLASNISSADPGLATYTFRVYLSTNDIISSGDTLLGTFTYSFDYAPMQNVSIGVPAVTIPNVSPGTYWLGAIIDPGTDGAPSNNDTSTWDAQQITVTAAPPPAPGNNDCSAAYGYAIGNTAFGTTTFATADGSSSCPGNGSPDVWYVTTAPYCGTVHFDTCGSYYDTVLSAHLACGAGSISCNDDSYNGGNNACGPGILQSGFDMAVSAGVNYWIRVAGFGSNSGNFYLNSYYLTPANDDCPNATAYSAGTTISGCLGGATNDGSAGCGASGTSGDVWYVMTPAQSGYLRMDTCGSAFDTVLSAHTGCPGGLGNQIACNDDSWNGGNNACGVGILQSGFDFGVVAGTTYRIRIAAFAGNTGTGAFTLHSQFIPPPNDACANAIPINVGTTVTGVTTGAGTDGSSSCGFSGASADVWYKIASACGGLLRIDTCGSSYDTVLSVHTGCPGTTGNEVACNDDAGSGGPGGCPGIRDSALQFIAAAGATYYIRVSGYNGDAGAFNLNSRYVTPGSDSCATAPTVGDGDYVFTNCGATTDGPLEHLCNFCCGDYLVNNDLWFNYTAAYCGTVTVKTCNSANPTFDTKIAVYHGGCPFGDDTAIACNDDSCGTLSQATFTAVVGQSYLIRVGGYAANRGTATLTISNQGHCGSADFDCDGDVGTDFDIEAFFRCIAGTCPPPPCCSSADFNADGDSATDADIEAFFRVLAGGTC